MKFVTKLFRIDTEVFKLFVLYGPSVAIATIVVLLVKLLLSSYSVAFKGNINFEFSLVKTLLSIAAFF